MPDYADETPNASDGGEDKTGASPLVPLSPAADEAIDLFVDLGEPALDSILDGPAKDIPVLGSVVKLFRGAGRVRDILFERKLVAFVKNSPRISTEDRRSFLARLESDPQLCTKTATHLTIVLDRLDDFDKVSLLARIFAAFIGGRISLDDMRRLSSILDRALVADLMALHDFVRTQRPLSRAEYDGLESVGLVLVDHSIIRPAEEGDIRGQVGELHFILSNPAKLLVDIALSSIDQTSPQKSRT
jgi:hypothetical protein